MTQFVFQSPPPNLYCATDDSGVVLFDNKFYNTVTLYNVHHTQIKQWFNISEFDSCTVAEILDTTQDNAELIINQLFQNNLVVAI